MNELFPPTELLSVGIASALPAASARPSAAPLATNRVQPICLRIATPPPVALGLSLTDSREPDRARWGELHPAAARRRAARLAQHQTATLARRRIAAEVALRISGQGRAAMQPADGVRNRPS